MSNTLFFSSKPYVETSFNKAKSQLSFPGKLVFNSDFINENNAVLAKDFDAVSVFVNDNVDEKIIKILKESGCKLLALRCAGYNNVDLEAAEKYNLKISRVPEYSPYSVAEHAIAILQTLNRKIHKAYLRTRELNFNIDGLEGFDLHGKTIGVIGTGKIGRIFIDIALGFGMKVIAYDPYPNSEHASEKGYSYTSLENLYKSSDIIALHCPLTEENYHMINDSSLSQMKDNVYIVNTSRGGLIETKDVLKFLKNGKIGGLAIDVYEEEQDFFFNDLSNEKGISDDILARLLTFNNVLVTSHQAFFTSEALSGIANITLGNINSYINENNLINEVKYRR